MHGVRGPAGPGARSLAGSLCPAVPAGLTLAPTAAHTTGPCTFRRRSILGRPGLQPGLALENPWGSRRAQNPESNPEAGDKSRFRGPAPSGPLGGPGTYPSGRPGAQALRWAGQALASAPPGASTWCVSQLNVADLQWRAKACAQPPGYLEIAPFDRTRNNCCCNYRAG